MTPDVDFDNKGILIHWQLVAKWFWRILELAILAALGFHISLTRAAFISNQQAQDKQDQRMDKIERAIANCILKQENKSAEFSRK